MKFSLQARFNSHKLSNIPRANLAWRKEWAAEQCCPRERAESPIV